MSRHFSALFSLLLLTLISTPVFAIGLLIPNDTSVRPFDVESHRATVVVTNNAAVTTVEQVFRNHTDRPMEAVFVFPIPEGGTVSDFSLWINGKKTKGAVLEKKQARQIYESIVRRAEDPGLVEYMDGKLFRASIFPIPPRGTQKLELKFGQVLKRQGGMHIYEYPLAAGKKYVTAKTAQDFTLTATINSSIPITNVYSPTHRIGTHRKSDSKVIVGTEELRAELDRDFQLFLSYSRKDIGVSLMTHDPDGDGGQHGYFMMAIAPRVEAAAHDEIGQTFTFVMDTSGSMAGEKIEQARQTLEFCIARLKPHDHFNVVRFSTDVEALWDAPVPATAANRRSGVTFAEELSPAGGTAIEPALATALGQKTPKHQPHQVIFVTDGRPTVGMTNPSSIIESAKTKLGAKDRLFTFGVGYEANAIMLDGLAGAGRGRADYVSPGQKLESAVAALYTRISSPVLSNVKVEWGNTRVYDVYPNPIPDLFRGDQLVLFGRNRNAFSGRVAVTGYVGKAKKSFGFGGPKKGGKSKPVKLDASSVAPLEFMPKLWATRKVGFLLGQIRVNGEQPELKNEVIRLAKKFGLVTPYTSYLAVDDSELEQPVPDRRVRVDRDRRPFDQSMPAPEPAMEDAPASAKPRRGWFRRKSKANKKSMSADSFGAASGEGAIAASEATREYKEKDSVGDDSGVSRRYVSGRTFEVVGKSWSQDGLSKKQRKKATVVKSFSKKYFELMKKHPDLKRIASQLGSDFYVKLGSKVFHITPAK
jgi:Ca-activated chloride channel family protein